MKLVAVGSDRLSGLAERGSETELFGERLNAKFVVSASQAPDESVPADHEPHCPVAPQAAHRVAASVFNRPNTSWTAPINAFALSVVTCSGQARRWQGRAASVSSGTKRCTHR